MSCHRTSDTRCQLLCFPLAWPGNLNEPGSAVPKCPQGYDSPSWVIPMHESGGHKGIRGGLSPGGDTLLTCWDSLAAAAASPVSMEATLVPSRTGLSCLGTDGPTRAAGKKVSLPRVATQRLSTLPDLPALPSSAPESQGQVTFWGRSARAPTSCGGACPTPAGQEGQEGSVLGEPDPTLLAAMMGPGAHGTLPASLVDESQGRGPAHPRDTALLPWQEPGRL